MATSSLKLPFLLQAVLALVAGVALQFHAIHFTNYWLEISALFGFFTCLNFVNKPSYSNIGIKLFALLFIFGISNKNAYFSEKINAENYFTQFETATSNTYFVEIIEPPEEKKNSYKCVGDVFQTNNTSSVGRVNMYFEKSTEVADLKLGDIIQTQAQVQTITKNTNPNSFDFAQYSRVKGIYHQVYLPANSWKQVDHKSHPIANQLHSIRNYFDEKLSQTQLGKNELAVIKALVLGDKTDLNDHTRNAYAAAGAMHILAVSGLHVGIVMLILTFLLKPIKRLKYGNHWFTALVILAIWIYALITGGSSSVLRAAFMFSFIVFARGLERDQTSFQAVLVSAFFLILFKPYIIFDVGFQLSYAAVIGIIFLQPKIAQLILIKNNFINYFWQILAVSIAAQIATAPLSLYYFHQFPTYFLITNIIVIPAAFIILFLGILFLAFAWVPFLGNSILYCLEMATGSMNYLIQSIAAFPSAVLKGYYLLKFEVLLLYTAIFGLASLWIYRLRYGIYVTVFSALTFTVVSLNHELNTSFEARVIFYALKNTNAIDIQYGNQHDFYYDQNLISSEEFEYNIAPNWIFQFNNQPPQTKLPLENTHRFISGGTAIGIVSETLDNLSDDYVYFKEDYYIDEVALSELRLVERKIILGGNCSYKFWSFLKKKIPNKVHYLKVDGALIADF